MIEKKQVSLKDLAQFGSIADVNEQAKSIVAHQKNSWLLAQKNFDALGSIQTNFFDYGHFKILSQFNPERIRSSAAKTDPGSIAQRPCFLCLKNLPEEQRGIVFQDKYLILVNPFPIFPIHLTISHKNHVVQEIESYLRDMLEIAKSLHDFTIFYNGPKTGASAPDHFHFQAIIKNSLPIEDEFEMLEKKYSTVLFQNGHSKMIAVDDYLRYCIAIHSDDKNEIAMLFSRIYQNLKRQEDTEPMMNVLCSFQNKTWRLILFPRSKQRSFHFYGEGEKQIMVSPASVEMGGVLVVPREEDFKKINSKNIAEIYQEVTLNRAEFEHLKKTLTAINNQVD